MDKNVSDENIEKAIDDIFGTDFIEIDVNNDDSSDNIVPDDNVKYFDDNASSLNNEDETVKNFFSESDFKQEETVSNNLKSNDANLADNALLENKNRAKYHDKLNGNDKDKESKKVVIPPKKAKSKNKTKKPRKKGIFITVVICLVLVTIFTTFIIYTSNNKEKVTNCFLEAEDTGYKITDEYKITYVGSKIKYVDGKYVYKAKNEEYKSQIEYIREEKLPIIINSNGMGGFTYLYEVGDDYFSVNSYLDFTLFEFDVIDKNDNESNPISYIKINSKLDYPTLINGLEKNGYKCVLSK